MNYQMKVKEVVLRREANRREREAEIERQRQLQINWENIQRRRDRTQVTSSHVHVKLREFHEKMSNFSYCLCNNCKECFPDLHVGPNLLCTRCLRDKREPKMYSAANNMDPGFVPEVLKGLSQVEDMLIAQVMPIMSAYKLPLGQYGYTGHIVNLPQDISSFVKTLPRDKLDVVIVRRANGQSGSYKDFRVRRSRILQALQWLKENNVYYRDIAIDLLRIQELPEDDEITNLPSIDLDEIDPCERNSVSDVEAESPITSFVPVVHRNKTEQETIQSTINWSQVTNIPLNEFVTPGYFTCAFPALFPTGDGDFTSPRVRKVTMYGDGRFAKHPRFRYFALNTEMRWRALQTGRIYLRQHPEAGHLSVGQLQELVNSSFSSQVYHFASSITGTRSYWMKQRAKLIAMVDTLGLPTVFFTMSAADFQWPELARLNCCTNPQDKSARIRAVIENPAITDWFFYQPVKNFIKYFFIDILHATDHWLRFEWQHRGSPHVHGLAWLAGAPDIEQITTGNLQENKQEIISFINSVVSTSNPALLPDGTNLHNVPSAQTDPHICNKTYNDVQDYEKDLIHLIATCQRHTVCSPAYCLQAKNNKQEYRFGYPKPLCSETTLTLPDSAISIATDMEVETERNDPLINSYNPIQLSGWRANVDMQYCVSRNKVIQYCAKYATKCEPRSQTLKAVYSAIDKQLNDTESSLKVIQKVLISATADRDYSAQETCHLLLQQPLCMTSREFVVLNLDGSRLLESVLDEAKPATVPSIVDHYVNRPSTAQFESLTLLQFAQNYSMPNNVGANPKSKPKALIVTVRPHISPDPNGPNYEQCCQQKLILHRPFRAYTELKGDTDNWISAYSYYLMSGNIPNSLENDLHRMQQSHQESSDDSDDESLSINQTNIESRSSEDWMIACRSYVEQVNSPSTTEPSTYDWTIDAQQYTNLQEMSSFITRAKLHSSSDIRSRCTVTTSTLQDKQHLVYSIVQQHYLSSDPDPLRMIISGTAGTGKSYLIACLKSLLGDIVRVAAPTGVAAFNIEGVTLHSLLHLPIQGDFREVQGEQLQRLQKEFTSVQYVIIDEISMVGRNMLSKIDSRLRQAYPKKSTDIFGGCSCLLFGDFGQLSPVLDTPLYSITFKSPMSDLGRSIYQTFTKSITLTQVIRQNGNDPDQIRFRELLMHLRNGTVTLADWNLLITRCLSRIPDAPSFNNALRLYPTIESVAEYNLHKLHQSQHPVAVINAIHKMPHKLQPTMLEVWNQ